MSRGKGCAGYNEAGIYTRVKRQLEWIFEHIAKDNCDDEEEDSQDNNRSL